MAVYSKRLTVRTKEKISFLKITDEVKKAVKESGVQDGIVLVNPMHVTASVFVSNNEKEIFKEFKNWLEKLAPKDSDYKNLKNGAENSHALLWRAVMGRETILSVQNFELELGISEDLFYGEFDGQSDKKILIKVLGE